jgi:hypothetical protein
MLVAVSLGALPKIAMKKEDVHPVVSPFKRLTESFSNQVEECFTRALSLESRD